MNTIIGTENTIPATEHHFTELEMSQIDTNKPLNKKRVVIIIIAFILLFALGTPLLLRLAIKINSPKDNVLISVSESPAPIINLPAEFLTDASATSEAKFELVIKANTKEQVTITQNSETIAQVNGNLDLPITQEVLLKDGENVFFASYKEPLSNSEKTSLPFKILFKKSKPQLTITSPSDNEGVSGDEVLVAGSTDKENTVTVNNLPASIDQSGNFQIKIRLKNGTNAIKVVAIDIAKNITEEEFNIEYSGN